MKRSLESALQDHLKSLRQMVFLTGPRQVGKTTLARRLAEPCVDGLNYFNWDNPAHRRLLLKDVFFGKFPQAPTDKTQLVFDEIHKYSRWKNTLKGLFDVNEPNTHWIVTGSALLNVYRRGQDSLLGRHFTYHLHPFSVAELLHDGTVSPQKPEELNGLLSKNLDRAAAQNFLESLMKFSGFPEPFFKKSPAFLGKWRTTRLDKLINQDLAAIEQVRNLPLVEQLMTLLPDRASQLLSINSLREEMEVHFTTVKHWLDLLERAFYGFRLYPFSGKLGRALKKESKWYLWDWTEIDEEGLRFENLVAVHLSKYVDFLNEQGLDELNLRFVRDKEKREVDFVICRRQKPLVLIECKKSATEIPASLFYFAERFDTVTNFVVTLTSVQSRYTRDKNREFKILPAALFLGNLV